MNETPPKRRNREFGFETRMIHAGTQPEPVTGARQTPIFQHPSYVFPAADPAPSLFPMHTSALIHSLSTNPTAAPLDEPPATPVCGDVGTPMSTCPPPPTPH